MNETEIEDLANRISSKVAEHSRVSELQKSVLPPMTKAPLYILMGLAIILLGNWLCYHLATCICLSMVSFILVDVYILSLVIIAAAVSDQRFGWITNILGCDPRVLMPTRVVGMIQFVFLLLIVILSFANIYFINQTDFEKITTKEDAFLFSWGVISTNTFDFHPQSGGYGWYLAESYTGFVLILAALAFLISRIATFADR